MKKEQKYTENIFISTEKRTATFNQFIVIKLSRLKYKNI